MMSRPSLVAITELVELGCGLSAGPSPRRRPGVCRASGPALCVMLVVGVCLFGLFGCLCFQWLCVQVVCGRVCMAPVPLPHWDFRPLFWMPVQHRGDTCCVV
jgi:hypothetical protein